MAFAHSAGQRRFGTGPMTKTTTAALWAALVMTPAAAWAWEQPPIQSPQDAACRQEAASRIFSEPNPRGLDLYSLGRQIWYQCMARAERSHRRGRRARPS